MDGIFVHELQGFRRAFVLLNKMGWSGMDRVLNLPLLRDSEEKVVVGLPAVGDRKLWMMDYTGGGSGLQESLWLHCTWDVRYL